ncbi:NAD-dependent epimerase/dehydratase family protein [Halorubellus litoreus]|uniref:NAD-dependent epimerase/dehydratase family protein n=1 Tax=Halorubellus litoreus TaxID=755308 RepID=A0ABD5VJ78_9EURY
MSEQNLVDRTVLVTGGAGFIGSHLVDALVEENEVRVLDDLSTGQVARLPDDVELVHGDVRNEELVAHATKDVDVVFHQAANVSVPASVENPMTTDAVNVDGTLAVLEAAREEDARVVVASSCAVYGDPLSLPLAETDRLRPESPYGVQKATVDEYARLYNELYGLETVALRYFNVYGPRQGDGGGYSGVISIFLEQARNGEDVTVEGDGSQTRDFVHVSDVVRANLAAATTDAVGEAFNVCTGTETSVLELAEHVVEHVDSNADIVNVEERAGDIARSYGDDTKARHQLEFETTVELEDGIRDLSTR